MIGKIMKNYYRCLTLLLFIYVLPASLTASAIDSVNITGVLTPGTVGFNGGFFNCKVIGNNASEDETMFSKNFEAAIKNNQFKITVPANSDLFYATFSLTDTAGKTKILSVGNESEAYLLQKGDSINIRINGSFMVFSGSGAEKLSCQFNLYSLMNLPNGANDRYCDLISNGDYSQAYSSKLRMIKIQLAMKRAVLNSYQNSLPASVINRFYADHLGMLYHDTFYSLYTGDKKDLYKIKYLNDLNISLGSADTSLAALSSIYYSQCLLWKELTFLRFQGNTNNFNRFSFKQLYDNICNKYQGGLRDKILLQAFVDMKGMHMPGMNKTDDVFNYVDDALSIMGNNESKRMLQEWREKVAIGKNAYEFNLEGENGQRYSLDDFKGKIIVADFWFNGCMGCTQMPGALKTVYEKYKDDNRVAWLSICVDKDAKWWQYGMKSGLYTMAGEINLFTDGMGSTHPMLAHYGYSTFPQLLVIDGVGHTADAYPPDPRIDKGEKLIILIDKLLR